MSKKQTVNVLPPDTKVELIAIDQKGQAFKKVLTLFEAQNVKRKKGFEYHIYQLGYSAYKNVKILK